MATIAITVTAGAVVTRSRTISAAHLTRFVASYRTILGQVGDGSGGMRDRTDAEVLTAWADNVFDGARATVRQSETDAVRAAVTDISFT
jgi:hypothetical protein